MKFGKKSLAAAGAVAAGLALAVAAAGPAHADSTAQSHGIHVVSTSAGSVDVGWRGVGPAVQDEVLVYNASTLQGVVHAPLQAGHSTDRTVALPSGVAGQALALKVAYTVNGVSTGWSAPVTFYASAAGGLQGAPGPAGPAGANAFVGTQSFANATAVTLPAIGGSWTAGHAKVGTEDLKAGTYLVTLTGNFFKTAATTATPVLQIQLNGADRQLTGYTGAFPANAAEGTGLGADGTPNGLEQDAVAVGIVTLKADTSVEIDAFGYNPDRSGSGGGDFGVYAVASFAQVNAG